MFNVVNGRGDVVGAEFSAHPDIAKVSFTGSTAVGKSILRAGAETLKRVTLELGGKSPTLLLEDADFATAIPLAVRAGVVNSGQACIAGTRILVPRARMAQALPLIAQAVARLRVGDPRTGETDIGAMVSRKQWERVQGYIALGLEEGARLLAGGPGRPAGLERGWFVRPTVFADVRNDMRIAREEIFGPVVSIIPFDSEEEALRLANATPYGLSGSIWSRDIGKALRAAKALQAGVISVNSNSSVHTEAPFGGYKMSGIGRELGMSALDLYTETKNVFIDLS